MINITLPDGSIKQVESGTTAMDIAMGIEAANNAPIKEAYNPGVIQS